jgi:hypothetical protein
LGPLLFLIYVNDISQVVPDNKLKLFADDTNLFLHDDNLHDLEIKANLCLDKMGCWFTANKLSLNIDKTCYTLFSGRSVDDVSTSLDLYINCHKIKNVASCKYLGVIIDDRLKWDLHIEHVYKKLLKFTGMFYKLRNVLPSKCLQKLYYAFVHPHILFGLEVYGNASVSSLNKLCILNNKLLRILLNKNRSTPIIEMYEAYRTLPIPKLFELKLLIFVHKCVYHKDVLPVIFQTYYSDNTSIHSHNTRRNTDLVIFRSRSTFGQKCTKYIGCKLWNSLPPSLKSIESVNVFKQKCRNYINGRPTEIIV